MLVEVEPQSPQPQVVVVVEAVSSMQWIPAVAAVEK